MAIDEECAQCSQSAEELGAKLEPKKNDLISRIKEE